VCAPSILIEQIRTLGYQALSPSPKYLFMTELNATTFFQVWYETVHNRRERLLEIWRNPKVYTHYIKNHEDSVLKEIAKKLDLQCFPHDYYCVDAIFFKDEDRVPDIEYATWVRDIRVAFEHENNYNSGLYKEVSHLLLINCDLKVLVTYYPRGDYETELEYLHQIIRGSRQSKTLSDNDGFLFILGGENEFEWVGRVYKEDKWHIIQPAISNK
jgi:hypothetical protein